MLFIIRLENNNIFLFNTCVSLEKLQGGSPIYTKSVDFLSFHVSINV